MLKVIRQQGFSLLEVQVALGLLALGLGLASQLYLAVGQQARLTYERQQAMQVLQQIVTVLPYFHQHVPLVVALSESDQAATEVGCDAAKACSTEAMWMHFWHGWQTQISKQLPAGKVALACQPSCAKGQQLRIEISWGKQQQKACTKRCIAVEWAL